MLNQIIDLSPFQLLKLVSSSVGFRYALPISVNLAALHSVAQTFSLRLIGHKLKVYATKTREPCYSQSKWYDNLLVRYSIRISVSI